MSRLDGLVDTERRRWCKRGAMEGRGGVKESKSLRLGDEGGGHGCHFSMRVIKNDRSFRMISVGVRL